MILIINLQKKWCNCGLLAGKIAVKNRNGPERLGEAGLALDYANIINQINMIVSL